MSLLLFLVCKQFEMFTIPFTLKLIERNEAQGRGVYAIAQSTSVLGAIVKNMAKMAVTVALIGLSRPL
jgi:hypothetical protein